MTTQTKKAFNAAKDLKPGQMTVVNGEAIFKPVIYSPSTPLGGGVFTLPFKDNEQIAHAFKVIQANQYEQVFN